MRSLHWWVSMAAATAMMLATPAPTRAGLVATYQFQGNLNADQGGVPALTATDPLGANGFETTTLYGHTRQVYDFNGNTTPSDQAGLTFNNSGSLITSNNYSVEIVFEFSQREGAWRRILDVQNRQSDDGFYVDPSNHLDIFPVAGGGAWTNSAFHDVVLTVASSGTVDAYLDGSLQLTTNTAVMNINNPENVVNFFLDNTVGGGQGEFSSGKVGLINLYDGVVSASDVATMAVDPFAAFSSVVPEPSTLASAATSVLILLGVTWRRHRRSLRSN